MARAYVINKRTPLRVDHHQTRSGVTYQLQGFGQLESKLNELMDKETLAWAKKMLRREARPLVRAMRANIKKSKKKTTITTHRHYSRKKGIHTIDRKHRPGQLRRSIGVLASKKYKDIPLIYVGNRRGVKYANDGWYGHFTEFGTRKGINSQAWNKRALQSTGPRVKKSMEDELVKYIGKKSEA